jgi:hypothetical protein
MTSQDLSTGETIYGACVDCVSALANGVFDANESAADGWLDRFTTAMWSLEQEFVVILDGEPLGFSMDRCDICRSRSGGDRYRVFIEEHQPEGEQQ